MAEEDGELLAAEARRDVAVADGLGDRPADGAQDLVAGKPLVDRYTAETYNGVNGQPGDHTVVPQSVCPASGCVDTIALGNLLVGGGAGLWIDVQKYVALIVDVSVLGAIAAGDGQQSGMNIDVSLGVGVHF